MSEKEICLVLGKTGMLGHMVVSYIESLSDFEVYSTSRNADDGLFFDATKNLSDISHIIEKINPSLIINCIGIINRFVTADNKDEVILLNSHLPHYLANICKQKNIKLIHISTDCVFSGDEGNYTEISEYSPTDFYGLSKAAGEVIDDHNLTIRTSIIGPEIKEPKTGLMEWFFSQEGKEIFGFDKVIWSGVTTLELAKKILEFYRKGTAGLLVLASNPISKYELLKLMKEIYSTNIVVNKDSSKTSDRSMRSVRNDVSYVTPSHREMLTELKSWMENKNV